MRMCAEFSDVLVHELDVGHRQRRDVGRDAKTGDSCAGSDGRWSHKTLYDLVELTVHSRQFEAPASQPKPTYHERK